MLVAAGSQAVDIGSVEQIIGRCLAGEAVTRTEGTAAREHKPDLVRVACKLAKPLEVIRRLVELGWDVNVKNGTTALHQAVGNGRLDLVQALVTLGADPSTTDDNFNATPAGWAEHFGHTDIQNYFDGLLR